ncbi:MAG: hypothetical protein AAF799_09815 [Myxococcota bacterium]
MNEPSPKPVPDLWVEKLALGELPEAEAEALRARLEADGDERLVAIEHSNEAILREHPPAEVAAEIERRLRRLETEAEAPRRPMFWVWAPVAAVACVGVIWLVRGAGSSDEGLASKPDSELIARGDPRPTVDSAGAAADAGPETIYLKGDPQLIVDRIEAGRLVRMDAEHAVASGDRLQLAYLANGAATGVIVSIDGAGVATLHFPETETAAATLRHGGSIPLRTSYELDDAPDYERFFFVTADESAKLSAARVMDAARALAGSPTAQQGSLELPAAWRQQSLTLRK